MIFSQTLEFFKMFAEKFKTKICKTVNLLWVDFTEPKPYFPQAMINFLQGHESKAAVDNASKKSVDERKLRTTTLRNQREEWKINNSTESTINHDILQEG